MIILKAKIFSILLINLFCYSIKCSPVVYDDMNRNNFSNSSTELFGDDNDLIVVDLIILDKNKDTKELTDDEFSSGDGEIVLNLKSPLDILFKYSISILN